MSVNPLISVVIPAYNAEHWIARTLASVIDQTFRDFEVIVVDDGSTDKTAAVVAEFGAPVRCIRQLNGGQSSARNLGILSARGEYVAFVDADDLWVKEKLQLQTDFLKRTGLAWVYSDAFAFDGENEKKTFRFGKVVRQYEGDIHEPLFFVNFIPSPTPVIRKSVFEHVGYFDEDKILKNREDWDMWLRIAACYPIGLTSKPLAHYRVHSTSSTGGEDTQAFFQGLLAVVERAIAREPLRLYPFKDRAIANCYIRGGGLFARRGDIVKARPMFKEAIRISPSFKAYVYWLGCLFGEQPARMFLYLRKLLYAADLQSH